MNREELAQAGFELDDAEHALLQRYVELLLDENARVNLTGTRAAEGLWGQHVCDSLALLGLIADLQPQSLIDVGTGGGLPGLVIACVCPRLRVTLMDATKKKLDALERMAAALDLNNVATLWGRAEALAHNSAHRERYDAATVRAVGDLRTCVEYATGFVKPGGQAWFFRSVASAAEDVELALKAANRCRMTHLETRVYQLPEPHGQRALLHYRKDRELLKSLPRAVGTPKAKPLK